MLVAQKITDAEITEQDSFILTRNLLRIAIFNISDIRGLIPEKYFDDKSVSALELKIKKPMPVDAAESCRMIDWMEKVVYDALQKKYLKTLLFCVCQAVEGPMIEKTEFSFGDLDSEKQEVSMNINGTGNKKQGGTFKCSLTTEITPELMSERLREKYFDDTSVSALELKIKRLMLVDAESRRLIDLMEKGIYYALHKKYLQTLLLCVCEAIEKYAFSFGDLDSEKQEVFMNNNGTGNKKQGGTFKCSSTTEIIPEPKSTMGNTTRELLKLVGLTLRIKDLLTIRLVSKLLLELTLDREFALEHYTLAAGVSRMLVHHKNESSEVRFINMDVPYLALRDFPFVLPLHDLCLVGSCHGMLAFCFHPNFLIWNPVRNLHRIIDGPTGLKSYSEKHRFLTGFGYDKSKDDYVIIIGSYDESRSTQVVQYFSVRSNTWTECIDEENLTCKPYQDDRRQGGMFFQEQLHWPVKNKCEENIMLTFDLQERKFLEHVILPVQSDDGTVAELRVIQNKLALCCCGEFYFAEGHVWLLDSDRTWRRLCSLPSFVSAICSGENEEEIIGLGRGSTLMKLVNGNQVEQWNFGGNVLVVDEQQEDEQQVDEQQEVKVFPVGYLFVGTAECFTYRESLIWLH